MNAIDAFHKQVALRFQLYNSLFLLLPFEGIHKTGTLLPLFSKCCEEGLNDNKSAAEIVQSFMTDYLPEHEQEQMHRLLFQFVQYVERQVVLFDSVEDAAYEQIKDLQGRGSLNALRPKLYDTASLSAFKELIQDASVSVVLTAHPTQFYPGEVLAIITDLDDAIKTSDLSNVDLLLRQLGKTPFIKKLKPSPYDEAVSLIWYLENIFYKSVPKLLRSVLDVAGISLDEWKNDDLFRIGFWPGGDRDGNPFVNSEITLQVADKLKNTLLKCYYRDLRALRRRLSFKGVLPLVLQAEKKVFAMAYEGKADTYAGAQELFDELNLIRNVIKEQHNGLFMELVEDLIIKVRIFGFFFARMDLRQHNQKHRKAIHQIMKKNGISDDYMHLDEQARQKLLLQMRHMSHENADEEAQEFVSSLAAMKQIQEKNGSKACCRYIISNAGSACDVLEVFALARNVFNNDDALALDVVPLFESIDDLADAPKVMEALYRIPDYRSHIKSRANQQVIMLGFSDGTKDGGYLKANWSIYKAKEALSAVSQKHGVEAIFFDGRGGPPGRGGGNTYEYYAGQGEKVSSRHIQLTVQGQTISANFGKTVSCIHNLEQLFCALVDNQLFLDTKQSLRDADYKLIDEMAENAYQAYLKVKLHSSFVAYLEKATPLRWFGETNIGSRPAKRNQQEGLKFEDLRAIPFVGSWAQMKQNIPGYFGIGTAFESINNSGKMGHLIDLCNRSPYFKTLLSNSMQSLTKCNFSATSWIANSNEFKALYQMLRNEYQLSVQYILTAMQQDELMQDFPVSKASVLLREKIVLPLVAIQQYALQRLNSETLESGEQKELEKLVLRCMFGIINAARNAA